MRIRRTILLMLALSVLLSAFLSSCSREGGDVPEDTADTPADSADSGATDEPAGKVFYVSGKGSDENPGTAEEPLASFSGAVKAVRDYKAENGLPEGGIEVVFAAGRYAIDSQTVFTAADSGDKGRPVVYRAENGAEVLFDGGTVIDPSAFKPAPDEIKAKLSSEDAKAGLLEADLEAAGCYDLTDHTEYSVNGFSAVNYRQELYVDNERQWPARWPDSGYETTEIKKGEDMVSELQIPEEKAALWAEEPRLRYFGYPYIDWDTANLDESRLKIDTERSLLTFPAQSYYGETKKSRYYIYNALCELDSPGEYYWDVEAKKLYYYPDGDIKDKKIVFSQLSGEWFIMNGASYIGFEGIVFENARGTIFRSTEEYMDTTHHISADGCVFRDIGAYAFMMSGSDIYVRSCDFYNAANGCLYFTGGDAKGHKSSDILIYNCYFHDYDQIYSTYCAAIKLFGYGFTVSHNEICNAPNQAVYFNCGETVIEYNYIHDVCLLKADAGAFYSGRRWDWSGNEIRYNYFRNIYGGVPLYLDDMLSGQRVYGNLFADTKSAIGSSGKYNFFVNNILVNVNDDVGIGIDNRGMNGAFGNDHVNYETGDMWDHLREGDYLSDVMRLAVPVNLLMLEQSGYSSAVDDPGSPTYNTAMNNIMIANNYADVTSGSGRSIIQSNIRYSEDPGFTDAENGDYTLRSDSRVFRDLPTFERVDYSAVGITREK